jgi:hypothetical protein
VGRKFLPAAAAATTAAAATAAAAVAAAAAATAAAAAAAATARTILSLVDAEGPAAHLLAVEGLDDRLHGVIIDFDEAEAVSRSLISATE